MDSSGMATALIMSSLIVIVFVSFIIISIWNLFAGWYWGERCDKNKKCTCE